MLRFPHVFLAGALFLSAPLHAQTATPTATTPRVIGTPGVRREAGSWLFNDSIFVAPGDNRGAIGGPVFLPNLRRDKKNKLPLFLPAKSGAPVKFSTLPLPDLRSMSAPGYDFAALQTQLAAQVNAARATGQSYVGWSLPTSLFIAAPPGTRVGIVVSNQPLESGRTAAVLKQLRVVLDAVAPDSALILQVNAELTEQAVADINVAAPLCDAVLLRVSLFDPNALWPLKMARRVAEEQPDFDLPIFVTPKPGGFSGGGFVPTAPLPSATPRPFSPAEILAGQSELSAALSTANSVLSADQSAQFLKFYMAGATGFVLPDAQTPAWASVISRNPGLFGGAVTLEDAAVLPSNNPRTLALVQRLRSVGRIPLAGRLPDDKRASNPRGESLFAILDDQTSLDTLSGLDKAARNGATIYLEGLPDLKNAALMARLSDMTGTTIEILPAPKTDVMTLTDTWLFGDVRGRELSVSQRVKWTIKTSLAAQARQKKGEDVLQAASAATLTGDANGLLIAPLGKGRIIWLAHTPIGGSADEAARRSYDAAIAGTLQGSLAQISFASVEDETRNGDKIHFSLRASKTGTPIIALFNDAASDATITLSARSDAPLALDLLTDRQIATKVIGYASSAPVTVPAHGFAWLTFGATRAALDKERLAPRPKARVIK